MNRLVVASGFLRRTAVYPAMLLLKEQVSAAAAEFMPETPMYELYQWVAPRPVDFGRLLDKIGDTMRQDFDFSADVRGLQVPTLVVAADADMAPPSHYVEFFGPLGGDSATAAGWARAGP